MAATAATARPALAMTRPTLRAHDEAWPAESFTVVLPRTRNPTPMAAIRTAAAPQLASAQRSGSPTAWPTTPPAPRTWARLASNPGPPRAR